MTHWIMVERMTHWITVERIIWVMRMIQWVRLPCESGRMIFPALLWLLIIIWVPRNWQLLLSTEWPTYVVAIGLGVMGIFSAYGIARLIKLHPMNARTVGLETGIQNGPLAIAVIIAIYLDTGFVDEILLVPALYSLFIVIVSTLVTFWFRRANLAEEQKIPNLL